MIGLGGVGLPLHSSAGIDVLEYRNHTYSGSSFTNPSIPSGIVAGDLLIGFGYKNGAGQNTPSGWTSVAWQTFGGYHPVAKISDGTETGDLEILDATSDGGIVLALKGGAVSLGSIVDSDIEVTNGNPSPQVKNATTLGSLPFVVAGMYSSSTGVINPRTWTGDDYDDEKGGNSYYIKWKFYAAGSSPSDITIDMDDEGNGNGLASAIIEVNF